MSLSDSSSSSDLARNVDLDAFEGLRLNEVSEINIIMLGETGVGKSTLINSMGNYLSLKYFIHAKKRGLVKVIPSNYTILDKFGQPCRVRLGPRLDDDETFIPGESATQHIKSFVFPIDSGSVKIRLIDTPGMGDSRGIEHDKINCRNIISYLRTLEQIHAICFLFKPTNTKTTFYFKYCIHQLLSLFERSAVENIFFLFCHTKGSYYGPGDTLGVLYDVLKNIEDETGIRIPFNVKRNLFCFDNEAFRYLGAREAHIAIDYYDFDNSKESWIHSAKECWKFIRYIQKNITPYTPNKLLQINIARNSVGMLSKLLIEISKTILENKRLLMKSNGKKFKSRNLLNTIKKRKIKVVDVIRKEVSDIFLVSTESPYCTDVHEIQDETKVHFKVVCHTCHELSKDIVRLFTVGYPEILLCDSIDKRTGICTICDCHFSVHMHINYKTTLIEEENVDEKLNTHIAALETAMQNEIVYEELLESKNVALQSEYDNIMEFCEEVAKFIRNTAIIDVSESFKDYVLHLIEQSLIASNIPTNNENLENLLKEFEEIKQIFELAMRRLDLNTTTAFNIHSRTASTSNIDLSTATTSNIDLNTATTNNIDLNPAITSNIDLNPATTSNIDSNIDLNAATTNNLDLTTGTTSNIDLNTTVSNVELDFDVDIQIRKLYRLNLFGEKIEVLYDSVKKTTSIIPFVEEYVHPTYFDRDKDEIRKSEILARKCNWTPIPKVPELNFKYLLSRLKNKKRGGCGIRNRGNNGEYIPLLDYDSLLTDQEDSDCSNPTHQQNLPDYENDDQEDSECSNPVHQHNAPVYEYNCDAHHIIPNQNIHYIMNAGNVPAVDPICHFPQQSFVVHNPQYYYPNYTPQGYILLNPPINNPRMYPQPDPRTFPQQFPPMFPQQDPRMFPQQDPRMFPQQDPRMFPQQDPRMFPQQDPRMFPQQDPRTFQVVDTRYMYWTTPPFQGQVQGSAHVRYEIRYEQVQNPNIAGPSYYQGPSTSRGPSTYQGPFTYQGPSTYQGYSTYQGPSTSRGPSTYQAPSTSQDPSTSQGPSTSRSTSSQSTLENNYSTRRNAFFTRSQHLKKRSYQSGRGTNEINESSTDSDS